MNVTRGCSVSTECHRKRLSNINSDIKLRPGLRQAITLETRTTAQIWGTRRAGSHSPQQDFGTVQF
jgi:hypothetical protein